MASRRPSASSSLCVHLCSPKHLPGLPSQGHATTPSDTTSSASLPPSLSTEEVSRRLLLWLSSLPRQQAGRDEAIAAWRETGPLAGLLSLHRDGEEQPPGERSSVWEMLQLFGDDPANMLPGGPPVRRPERSPVQELLRLSENDPADILPGGPGPVREMSPLFEGDTAQILLGILPEGRAAFPAAWETLQLLDDTLPEVLTGISPEGRGEEARSEQDARAWEVEDPTANPDPVSEQRARHEKKTVHE